MSELPNAAAQAAVVTFSHPMRGVLQAVVGAQLADQLVEFAARPGQGAGAG